MPGYAGLFANYCYIVFRVVARTYVSYLSCERWDFKVEKYPGPVQEIITE